jgi:hypothetical protein
VGVGFPRMGRPSGRDVSPSTLATDYQRDHSQQ